MKTVINATPSMKELIAAQLQKRSVWPWASRKPATIDKYRLMVDDKSLRVSGRITVNGRERSLGRSLKQELSQAYFYDRHPELWAQSDAALKRTFAPPAPKMPARSARQQGISGLLGQQPVVRGNTIARPSAPAATPPQHAFESPRMLARPVDRLGVYVPRQSQAWASETQQVVELAFARSSEESSLRTSRAPSLRVLIPHFDKAWGEELSAYFAPKTGFVPSRQGQIVRPPLGRHRSYSAELFDGPSQLLTAAGIVAALPPVPGKSVLRAATSETRRLQEELAYYRLYCQVVLG